MEPFELSLFFRLRSLAPTPQIADGANAAKPCANFVPDFETDSIWIWDICMYIHACPNPHVYMCVIFLDVLCAYGTLPPISFSCMRDLLLLVPPRLMLETEKNTGLHLPTQ